MNSEMNAEDLLNRKMFFGWSLKGLYQWACCIKSGLKPVYDISMGKRLWCLAHGFSPSAMAIWGEKEIKEHYRDYLSDKQYAKLHPINGSYTFWIDDKLTTKNCFYRYNAYFPSYYFQISGNMIFRLSDCKKQYEPNIDGIIACLDDVKELAIKRLVGSGGNGFYHLDKDKNGYYISGKLVNRGELRAFIEELDEYLIMEYIVNHKKLREIWPGATNTLRMLWGGGGEPVLLRSFLRFGNAKSKGVDNAKAGGIESIVDEENGHVLYTQRQNECGRIIVIECHPDTGTPFLQDIPYWQQIYDITRNIMLDYPQMKYMGFDIAIVDGGFKIIEINSYSGLMAAQSKEPLLRDQKTRKVFETFGVKNKRGKSK